MNHPDVIINACVDKSTDARPEHPPYSSQSQVTHNASTLHYYQLKRAPAQHQAGKQDTSESEKLQRKTPNRIEHKQHETE
jgi:hypothetical protein